MLHSGCWLLLTAVSAGNLPKAEGVLRWRQRLWAASRGTCEDAGRGRLPVTKHIRKQSAMQMLTEPYQTIHDYPFLSDCPSADAASRPQSITSEPFFFCDHWSASLWFFVRPFPRTSLKTWHLRSGDYGNGPPYPIEGALLRGLRSSTINTRQKALLCMTVLEKRTGGLQTPPWRRQGLEGTDNVTVQTDHAVPCSAITFQEIESTWHLVI